MEVSSENVKIQSKDGKDFTLTKKQAELSSLLKSTMQDFQGNIVVPLNEIDEKTTTKVVEYLVHYDGQMPPEIEKPLKSANMSEVTDSWSAQFVDFLSLEDLVDLTVASNFMEIQPLLDLTCAKIASMCKDKSEDEIFKTFNVTGTYTEEEKQKIRQENKWIEDNI
jgi:S-phase kinase-associated protein 1